MDATPSCTLCERQVPRTTQHHLTPKSRGGRETVALCPNCHNMIHSLYDNKVLDRELDTIEALRAEPRMASYLKWIRKRPGETRFRTRQSKTKRRR